MTLIVTAATAFTASPAIADNTRDQQWHLRYLKTAEAHRISQGEGITVAVIDTGVDPHPDLRGNLLPGIETFIGGTGDGRQDSNGHGTAMAGLIAAHGSGPTSGTLGIAPKAKILPIRQSSNTQQSNNDEALEKAIEWAVKSRAQVINMSFGSGVSPRLRAAVEDAISKDVVLVAAAGNQPPDYGVIFPAAYDGVVAVGATDSTGYRAPVSVTGKQLSIVAPGVDILSPRNGGTYNKGTGTSDSAAIVSGAVALIRSKYPSLSAKEVVHRLTATATDKGAPGRDPEYGYGELNLLAALTADVPPLEPSPTAVGPTAPTVSPTSTAPFASPRPRNDNTVATVVVVTVAVLLAVGLVVFLLVSRLRRRP